MSTVQSVMRHCATLLDLAADRAAGPDVSALRSAARDLRNARGDVVELAAAIIHDAQYRAIQDGAKAADWRAYTTAVSRAALAKAGAA